MKSGRCVIELYCNVMVVRLERSVNDPGCSCVIRFDWISRKMTEVNPAKYEGFITVSTLSDKSK